MIEELMEGFKGTVDEYTNELQNRLDMVYDTMWEVGFRDRGMGHGDYSVMVKFNGKNIVVCECPCLGIAQRICNLQGTAPIPLKRKKT